MSNNGHHILIAEDDPGIMEVVGIILSDAGYIPHVVSSKKEIEEVLKKEKISMIFLDVLLHGENGKSIAKLIKTTDATKKIPLVMLSANLEIQQIAEDVKADGYLQKPFDIDEFLAMVTKYVKN